MLVIYVVLFIVILYIVISYFYRQNKVSRFSNKRIIELKNLRYYFLTNHNEKRKSHIMNEFKNYKLIEVNPYFNIGGKNKSIASGFSRIYDLASLHQDYKKPFEPFVVMEDDVKKYRDFPEYINVPENTDILYIGLSNAGWNGEKWCYHLKYNQVDKDFIRVKNMLALHGLIICTIRGLLTLQKCMMEGFFLDKAVDIFTSEIQPYLNIYALRKPLVYQYNEIGGMEDATKFKIEKEEEDMIMPEEWINTSNIGILTINT